MRQIEDVKRFQEMMDHLLAEIDAGRVSPTERELLAVAILCDTVPILNHYKYELASRSRNGRIVLQKTAS